VLEALALVFSGQSMSAEKASSLIGRNLPTANYKNFRRQSKPIFLLHSFWAHFIVGKLESDSASAGSSLQSSLPLSCALEHEKGRCNGCTRKPLPCMLDEYCFLPTAATSSQDCREDKAEALL